MRFNFRYMFMFYSSLTKVSKPVDSEGMYAVIVMKIS